MQLLQRTTQLWAKCVEEMKKCSRGKIDELGFGAVDGAGFLVDLRTCA